MTTKNNNKQPHLLDQQVALYSYLDDLLEKIPDITEPRSVPDNEPDHGIKHGLVRKQEKQTQQQNVQTQVRQRPDLYPVSNPGPKPEPKKEFRQEIQQAPKQVLDIPVLRESQQVEVPGHVSETKAKIEIDSEVQAEGKQETISWDGNGVPDWAQERFKCLLFKVAGISLVIPLVKLNGVISWTEKITPVPGHSRSFLGVIRHQGQNVEVVDTAQIVVPEKQKGGVLLPPEKRLRNVILVDNCRWGLACDGIGEVITLEAGEVRWRTPKGKLKWLAGTILQHQCALLEVDTFTRLLREDHDQAGN